MALSSTGVTELSGQEIGTAWLVLITISHADLPTPIRVTSDAVATVSNGNTYTPFPFEVILPEDAEGRTPYAQLRIDNTTKEIAAALRGLTSPPTVTIQIVRSSAPDTVERSWTGLRWKSSTIDVGVVTGTLSIDDVAHEEFPYVTFDGRFPGLWA